MERRQRARAQPAGDVRGGARGDPRRLVRWWGECGRLGHGERRAPRGDRGGRMSVLEVTHPELIPGATHAVQRLLPDPAETTIAEQLAQIDLKSMALPDRPYLILNFVTTLDGRAAIDGRSGPIGSKTDSEMLA